MAKKPTRGKPGGEETPVSGGPEDVPERWSAQRKMELVLRLLRGEPLDAVSRESQVPARVKNRGLFGGRATSRGASAGGWRPKRGGSEGGLVMRILVPHHNQ